MFKAVVFDMDGVIFDSEKIYRKFEHERAAHYGLDDSKVDMFCDLIAGGTKEVNSRHFDEVFQSGIPYEEFRQGVMDNVDKYSREIGYDLKPGVREFLDFLKERGIKIALATSTAKERAELHLKSHGLYEYFDGFVYGDMIKTGKPEPDIYLKACEILGVAPEDAIGVEDSINGVLSSAAAGLYTIMVVDLIKPNEKVDGKAKHIFNKITEIEGVF